MCVLVAWGAVYSSLSFCDLAGALFGILVKFTNRFGRDVVVLLGMLIHFATFLLIFFNMPDSAIINDKGDNKGYLFSPSK